MRRLGLALLPLVVTSAAAQDSAKPPAPAAPPPADAPKVAEFLGPDAIRRTDGLVVHYYRVNYVDAKLLESELKKWTASPKATVASDGPTVLPTAPKSGAAPAAFQNTLRIEDTEENWPNLRRVLDMVDVPQFQVEMEAKIVEITFTDDLHMGIEAHAKRKLADTFFQSSDLRFPNRVDASNQFSTAFHEATKYMVFDYIVDLAEAGARTNITSKPRILASQGETAKIRVGDREPIVQQSLQGTSVFASTDFKDTGITLEVQPLVIGRDAVRARISAEASRVSDFRVTATSANLQVVNPVISTRNADTVVTVLDGETYVFGGLDQDFDRDQQTGIPLLMDIPVLGALFRSTSKRNEHTEMVFFLTFRITNPSEGRLVTPPSEKERTEK